jgi:hypothetical protein
MILGDKPLISEVVLSQLVLDMIKILSCLGKYKYDTWRILLVKCYIDSSMHLQSCIRNVNKHFWRRVGVEASIFYLSIDYTG